MPGGTRKSAGSDRAPPFHKLVLTHGICRECEAGNAMQDQEAFRRMAPQLEAVARLGEALRGLPEEERPRVIAGGLPIKEGAKLPPVPGLEACPRRQPAARLISAERS
jgi:hypothetical protein